MTRSAWTEPLPVRRVEEHELEPLDRHAWPATLAPVLQVLDHGLDLGRATVLVGENGTGKSTLVEGIAMAYGLSPEGGGTGARHSSYASESPLSRTLQIVRGPGASRWGYFVRAETMHGLFTYLSEHGGDGHGFHQLSHGESFLALLNDPNRFDHGGFIVLDEPEAGLSFTAQLTLLGQLRWLAQHPKGQVLVATHSPVIAALPRLLDPDQATLLQLDGDGIAPIAWGDLAVVDHYRRFLDHPDAYLRHLVD